MDFEKQQSLSALENGNSRGSSSSSGANDQLDDSPARRRLLWKLDLVIIPALALAYLLAYMDRNNIGYARLMGFQKDLHITNAQFYNCVMIFFAGYLAVVFPGNLLIRKLGPHIQLGFCVLFFGLCVCCMTAAKNYGNVLGLRFGIGAAEALLQSGVLYLSMWYRREELGKRIAIFYSAATLSGVFSGFIAYGVQKNLTIKDARPAWEWLFLIEGIIAVALGIVIGTVLPPFPDTMDYNWLLTRADVEVAKRGTRDLNHVGAQHFELWQVKASLLDPRTWLFAILAGVNATFLASAGTFLPTIVKAFGYSAVNAQLYTVIPYACAFVTMIIMGIASDRSRNKGFFVLGALVSVIIGLIILLATSSKQAGIVGASFLVMGAYPAAVLQIAWTNINFCGYTKRAVSWGISMIFGQAFSIIGTQVYTTPPRFVKGHSVLLAFASVGIIATVAVQLIMGHKNKKRDERLREYEVQGESHPDRDKSFEDTCDDHLAFRYTL